MASVHPAMRGKFGSTEYFMLTMKAGDAANRLTIPKEMPDWGELELEERYQREINYNRVKKLIAPYLANDPDRFFGALIVAVINPDEMEFEAMDNVSGKIPKLYQTASRSFGFVTLSGGEMLVPLDGQHRLAAIQFALSGKDEKQKPISGLTPNADLSNDDILLILIRHDAEKGRKIFNKVNRYAKATTKAENLITADDDVIALISREVVANELIGSRLVNYHGNTLADSMHYFTTLSTVYETTKHVLEDRFGKINDQELPEKAKRTVYEDTAREYWDQLLRGVTIYQAALADGTEAGDEKRKEIRKTLLLGKPICQLALMFAVVRLKNGEGPDGSRFSWETIVDRINGVGWESEGAIWQHILMNGSKVVSGRQAANFAGRFVAYYLGEFLQAKELENLEDVYANHFPQADRPDGLPARLFTP